MKVKKGEYIYRGFRILCSGYYEPEKKVIWEGIDRKGNAEIHGYTKKAVIKEINKLFR
jgi:hypothetical protein